MLLNVHSWFSLKYGIHSPEDLLKHAKTLGIRRMCLTDINNSSGMADFLRLAPQYGIEASVGVDIRQQGQKRYVLIAQHMEGLASIHRLVSANRCHGAPFPLQAPPIDGVSVIYPFHKDLPLRQLNPNEWIGLRLQDAAQLSLSPWRNQQHRLVVLQPVTFLDSGDLHLHRLLRAIDNNQLLSHDKRQGHAQASDIMQAEFEWCRHFRCYPQIILNTKELLEQSTINFDFGKPKNRKLFGKDAREDYRLLYEESYKGLLKRYENPDAATVARLEKELRMIHELGFTAYFLINWDLIQYAQKRGFFHVGRGSGANSLVAYCLGITDVDPMELDLYFERFINPHRKNPPDFDLDFSWKDRDEVLRYLFRKYPEGHIALLATYQTFQQKRALRELGKVFGLPDEEIRKLEHSPPKDNIGATIAHYSARMEGMPAHLSIHAGGVLISEAPLYNYTALQIPPKGFPMVQFSMLEAEDIGLYKFDILSQRGLGHIRDAMEMVAEQKGIEVPIHDTETLKKDPKVRAQLQAGQTMGCFYIESPAMRMLLKRLKASEYKDLVAASSIIRPGVARSGMMRAYIERFRDPKKVQHLHPKMGELMADTFGIMVYQEDVIKVAHHFAGLDLAEADVLRRGMSGKFRSREAFQKIKDRFFDCCRQKGYAEQVTQTVWDQIESFAGYSFSKAHSASYAVESYQSLYLKAHYPLEFITAVINNFGGFYRTEIYLHEARKCGASVQAPCLNQSHWLSRLDQTVIWLGFVHVKGLEEDVVKQILQERHKQGAYQSLEDLCQRVRVPLETLMILIRIGALRFTKKGWKELLWEARLRFAKGKAKSHPLFPSPEAPTLDLPQLHYEHLDDARQQIELLGFPLCDPFLLSEAPCHGQVLSSKLPKHLGQNVCIDGYLVTVKRTRTIKGEHMYFGTFLDRSGDFLDTVHFPPVLRHSPFRGYGVYRIYGKVTEDFDCYQIEVSRMERLSWMVEPSQTNVKPLGVHQETGYICA